jgi:NADH-quinone oxidoreductase subunit M
MFMFYEVALIPMYLLIGVWGTGRKEYAAMKLTLMLMGGSAFWASTTAAGAPR